MATEIQYMPTKQAFAETCPPRKLDEYEMAKKSSRRLPHRIRESHESTNKVNPVIAFTMNDRAPMRCNLPIFTSGHGFVTLYDHKERLETVFLHPEMEIERWNTGRGPNRAGSGWTKVPWKAPLRVTTKETLVLRRAGVTSLAQWQQWVA
ncbi:hypothetical protein R3P38DRAFT_3190862 [Favolaschia claudopus]|uniref:Uncharacterized protein n=1 Tax=Favolaschia claudopus TaxID=2862362 RepID=A0AAW0BNH7_9AGAR